MAAAGDQPIVRTVLDHTGRLDGDDTGYRAVAIDPLDEIDPDPLVPLPSALLAVPIYERGATAQVTPYYSDGLDGSTQILVREPVARALIEVDLALAAFDRRLLVLDGFRPAALQARLWAWVFRREVARAGQHVTTLSVAEWIEYGRAADAVASYCECLPDEQFADGVQTLLGLHRQELGEFGDARRVARELTTYRINVGVLPGTLDSSANTAHGSGGAVDVILADRDANQPVFMGVPFDSTSPAAVIDWFERHGPDEFVKLLGTDWSLRAYLYEFGLSAADVDHRLCTGVRRERRLLYHSMRNARATFFSLGIDSGEYWHFNLGNELGGNQSDRLPGAGNACHSLLRNVISPATGAVTAAWGNRAAHILAGSLSLKQQPVGLLSPR